MDGLLNELRGTRRYNRRSIHEHTHTKTHTLTDNSATTQMDLERHFTSCLLFVSSCLGFGKLEDEPPLDLKALNHRENRSKLLLLL